MSYRTKTGKLYGWAVLGKLLFGAGTMTIGSAVLTQFSSVTARETDERRDRRTDRRIIDGYGRASIALRSNTIALASVRQGRLQGGSGRNLLPNWAQGERITP